jgi:transcriptional regulator with XRE-family HTH domain
MKTDQSAKKLGLRIKEAREKIKLTQSEVAEKSDMTETYYAMIERGEVNPSIGKLRKILKVLNLKIVLEG